MLLKFDKILRKSIGDDDTLQHFYSIYMKSEKKKLLNFWVECMELIFVFKTNKNKKKWIDQISRPFQA